MTPGSDWSSFLPFSLFGPSWCLASASPAQGEGFLSQVGTGEGTVYPHPSRNLISVLLLPETSGHLGLSCRLAGSGARTDFRHECSLLGSEDLGTHRELSVSPPGFLGLALCPAVLPCRLCYLPFLLPHSSSTRSPVPATGPRLAGS